MSAANTQPAPRVQVSTSDQALWQKSRQMIATGQAAQTLSSYQKLLRAYPTIASLWFERGLAEVASLEFASAKNAFRRATELAPRDIDLLVAVGQQYHRLRDPSAARAAYQAAFDANPMSLEASLSLATWLERDRKLEEAWRLSEETLAKHPDHPAGLYHRAFFLQRKKQPELAEPILRDLLKRDISETQLLISCRYLLALVLDEMGQYAEAIACLRAAKEDLRRVAKVGALEQLYDNADKARRQLLAGLTPEMIRHWRQDTPASATPCPVALLGGHPRSGTTLLEQILGGHPGVFAVDESEAFAAEIWDQLSRPNAPASSAKDLDELSPSRRSGLRARYFKSLFRELQTPPTDKLVIDKNPEPTAALHFWLRLFPASRVIIALRDPRDVVISCYFQHLALTPINVNFLGVERAARHYADLMDVWLRCRELGGFEWMETRYEDLVKNVENEGRRVTEFLGLAWQSQQAASHESAQRNVVFSPTYADVAQPAHTRAIGRWKHYEEALAPALPRLASYCEKFGY